MPRLRTTLAGALLLAAALPAGAQSRAPIAEAQLQGLKWRNIGPANMGGRITDFAVAQVDGAPDVVYLGTAAGGVFRSSNQGTTWEPLFDDVEGLLSVGDIAVAPSNPSVVWVGMGESNNRQSISWGDGVYRSTDAGESWRHVGLKETRHVGRIVVHPANPDVAYVAAGGQLWGPNPERGVFRTTDGGQTWEKVLYVDEHTGATDLVMDPHDPQTLIAALYQRQRTVWGYAGGGPGSGIYKSTDGGDSWREITAGLPEGDLGRIGLDVYAGDGRILYASIEADPPAGHPDGKQRNGVYRSADRGESWEQVNTVNVRPMYFSQIRVDPNDPQRIYVNGTEIQISIDGGRTLSESSYGGGGVHPDIHAMWIDPRDSNHVLVGNDGGVMISWDAGENWKFIDNLALGQYYEIDADMRDPYYVCGGLQDNGSWCLPSATPTDNGITNHEVYNVGGGDGFYARIDPTDPNVVFVESQNGRLQRFHLDSRERQMVSPLRPDRDDEAGDRWNWNSPLEMSTFDPATIYYGGTRVWRSADRGVSWTAISPDLTLAIDRDTLEVMGARVTDRTLSRHDGVSSYGTLTTISESPLDRALLYAGSDDGRVHVTRDGGGSWTDLSARFPGLPARSYVSRLVASRHAAGRVYATFDGHHNNDYRPHVFVSDDFGQSWRSIVRGLPEETSVTVIREHPRSPRLLFVGHEKGLHASVDGGQSWMEPGAGLPNTPVEDILVHPRDNDLIAGTHGRSIWILDDLAPLEALASGDFASGAPAVLPSREARLINLHSPQGWVGTGQFFGTNPEPGAAIAYWLPEGGDSVRVSIRDASGAEIRSLRGPGQPGLNRIHWDFRIEPPFAPAPGEEPGSVPDGPRVLPGQYTAVLHLPGGAEATGGIRVVGDPRIRISDADRQARQAALMEAHEVLKTFGQAQAAARLVSGQLAAVQGQLGAEVDGAYASASTLQAARQRVAALVTRVEELEGDIGQEMAALGRGAAGPIDAYTGAPRPDQLRQIGWAYDEATRLASELNTLSQTELPALLTELGGQGLWPVPTPRIAAPVRR